MNFAKNLLLGTAAAAIAATGAQASGPGPAREPVYRCDATGFIELPGTDICFKVGGFARLVTWAHNDDATSVNGGDIEGTDGTDEIGMYAQGRLNFDARRSTPHGTVRAFIEIQATDSNGNTGGDMALRHAFAQMGNWVFGKTWSTYLHGASDPNGSDWSPVAHTIRINQIRYTTSVGNGLTMSFALEDHAFEQDGRTRRLSGATPTAVTYSNIGNGGSGQNEVPTIVANVNYANGGYDMQLSGVVKFNEYGDGSDEVGYGIMLGLAAELTDSLNAIMKINYTHANPSYQFDWWTNGTNTGDDHDQFGIMAGVSGQLTDNTTWQLAGFWGSEDNNGNVIATTASACSRSQTTETSAACAVDQDIWGISGLVQWRPASGFDILAEVLYRSSDYAGTASDTDEVIGGVSARVSF